MYLVIDVGGTAIKYGYLNNQGEIIENHEIMASSLTDLESFINKLSSIYYQRKYQIKGIALSCPGVIDATSGLIKEITAYPFLQGSSLSAILSRACDGLRVTIENDAKCAGLAEIWNGHAKECQDAIIVVLGTGIGGAIIKDKKIHHGANLFAGEISHMMVGFDNTVEKVLTWSDIASTSALCKRVANVLKVDQIDGRKVFELVEQSNQKVIQVLTSFCLDIAMQLYNLQYIYDPELICIGGGISRQEILLKMLKEAIISISQQTNQLLIPKVVSCKYYNEANMIGALYHHINTK